MKRIMLGTSALFALGLAAGTAAAEETPGKITLALGGFYVGALTSTAQSDIDKKGDGEEDSFYPVTFRQDGEIHFKGETTLDNGIKAGFRGELEVLSRAKDQVDEAFLFFSGGFGRLVMGADDDAAATMQYAEPIANSAGGANSPRYFIFEHLNAAPSGTYLGVVTLDNPKIIYFTPRFGGFQLGVSYTPNIDSGGGAEQAAGLFSDEDGGFGNAISAGANFDQSVGGINVALSAGVDTAQAEEEGVDDQLQFAVGGTLGFSGITVGGSVKFDDPAESIALSAGAMYEQGSWAVSAGFFHGEIDNATEDTLDIFDVSFGYKLSSGVEIFASGQFLTEDSTADVNTSGFGVMVGSALTF